MRNAAPLCALLLLAPAASAAEPVSGRDVRVMTFNIRTGPADDGENSWDRRRDLVPRAIEAFSPDILATQELHAPQARWLAERLPRYAFVGVGRDDGREAGEMSAIFFDRRRFAKTAEGHFWLSETPGVAGSVGWDAALTRIATWVRLKLEEDPGGEICVVDTHLDHVGKRSRIESARLIRRKLAEACGALPVIVAGDFNAPARESREGPYREMIRPSAGGKPALSDTHRGSSDGTYHAFTGRARRGRIDWILVSREFAMVAAGVDRTCPGGRCPSDHFPVTAVVRLGTPGRQ